jgi:hypothetical protein
MKRTLILLIVAVALLVVAWFVIKQDPGKAAPLVTADFAIEDTSVVGKVILSDTEGNVASIERGEGEVWMVNGKFPARVDAINLILKTLNLLEVKHPVSPGSRENVIRMMTGSHSYVRVYDRKGKLMKALYVGIMTPDQQGTYMVLETEKGKSDIPYVMTMKTFYGFLTSRFFTDETDWRSLTLFAFPKLAFNRVEILNNLHADRSFAINYGGGNDLSVLELNPERPLAGFDSTQIKDFLIQFKKVSCETYDLAMTQAEKDSVLALPPSFEIKINANEPAKNVHLKLFLRPAPEGMKEDDDSIALYDREIMYGTINGTELFRVQRFVIDHFLPPVQLFKGELEF